MKKIPIIQIVVNYLEDNCSGYSWSEITQEIRDFCEVLLVTKQPINELEYE